YLWAFGEWANSGFSSWAHLCGRAINNPWPNRVKTAITASGTPQWRNASCSGATTANVTGSQYQDTGINGVQPINGPQKNFIDANTKAITITLGGNDADILGLIWKCRTTTTCTTAAGPWTSILGAGAGTVETKLDAAYDAIQAVQPAGTKVVVVRYPAWVPDATLASGSGGACDDGIAPDYTITTAETAYIAQATRDLNQAIVNQAAGRTGWSTVDMYGPSQAGARHDMCATSARWLTGIDAGETNAVAWHPTGSGQVYPMHLNDAGHAAFDTTVSAFVLAA
ncbi:MAG TPA: GDSL-type esterase/lipase family protein, partial [Acidimicrobiales bacterium]|nr:GDSL-type esterase/lipase family protein [Acidimicrobiales bacterium]